MTEYRNFAPPEAEACEPLTVEGVECFALKHNLPPPFISNTNNSQMIDFMNSQGGPTIATMDGFNVSEYQDWKYLDGIDPSIAYYSDTQKLLENCADNGHVLVFGDFHSEVFLEEEERTAKIIKGVVFGGAAISAATYYAEQRKKKHQYSSSRRQFLKAAAWGVFSLAALSIVPGIADNRAVNALNDCDFEEPTQKIFGVTTTPSNQNLVARPALTIAKQAAMRDQDVLAPHLNFASNNISVWGQSHVQRIDLLDEIKKQAHDPAPVAESLYIQEVAYLKRTGAGIGDAMKQASKFRVDMAASIPVRVLKYQKGYSFTPIIQENDGVFIDTRILGFDPSAYGPKGSKAMLENQLLDVWNNV